jgi:two-component system NtrC family sensor kinase
MEMSVIDPNHQMQIEVEPFDREYELSELLPIKTLEELCLNATRLPVKMALCFQDGSAYFELGVWEPDQKHALGAAIMQKEPHNACTLEITTKDVFAVFPLKYELETKGYLAIPASRDEADGLPAFGQLCINTLQKIMHLKHQTMMTSGLHGMVVEESYARLEEKAAQLAHSEEKYRSLAANLQIEVQHKAAEIKTAHVYLMQQEKLAAIGQLAAGMAHEINTPLGFMISNLNSLKDYVQDVTDLLGGYRKLVELSKAGITDGSIVHFENQARIVTALETDLDSDFLLADMVALADETAEGASRIQKIVGDLKRVARPGEKEQELIDVAESIDAVLTILANRIGEGLTIGKDYKAVPLVPGVAQEMNQVWLNLLLNAVDAMEGNGTLNITVQTVDSFVEVKVSDTGCGIPEEHLSKIFDPFFTTKPVGSGTGLGLHLSFQVVNKHGGQISVISNPDHGTTFIVRLPAMENK